MDHKMVDNEEQRDDRRDMFGGKTVDPAAFDDIEAELMPRPNRLTRRKIAKERHVFKHPGAWGYVNGGRSKNKPHRASRPRPEIEL